MPFTLNEKIMQLEFFDVPSPCIGLCETDVKGLCIGCYRSEDERQEWQQLSSDNKQKVIKRCQQRKKRKLAQPQHKVFNDNVSICQPSLLPTSKK